jgi:short-subunit dehydrogenase
MEIREQVVVITGASSGIGEALAREVYARGGVPVIAARRADRLEALSKDLGGALAVQTDVTDVDQLAALIDQTMEKHGRIDVLVNNAGQGISAPVADLSVESLRQITDVNLIAPTVAMRLVHPIMKKQGAGTIINVSSELTRLPMMIPGYAAYVGAKSAINKISETARTEMAKDGIMVSLILPFITQSEFDQAQIREGESSDGPPPGMQGDTSEHVAEKMIELIESGEPEISLLPDSLRPPS